MLKKFIMSTSCVAIVLAAAGVQAFQFEKPIHTTALLTKYKQTLNGAVAKNKPVTLMKINLTKKEHQQIFSYSPHASVSPSLSKNNPTAIDVGMNGTPVLNQGAHGTCVTFAVTAALDAMIGKGDHISPLCSLELGRELESKGYFPSGWDGTLGPLVTDQFMRFGAVSMKSQRKQGCAGLKEYPLLEQYNEGESMSLDEYHAKSVDLSEKVIPLYHLNFIQRFTNDADEMSPSEMALQQVKSGLMKGNRSTLGTLLVISKTCPVGACGTYKTEQDAWVLSKETENASDEDIAGHELVVIGYDDNAVAVDGNGMKHKGLLTLRNSWGDDVGDNGNFFMSYDYFKKFVGEVVEFVPQKPSE